MGYNEVDWDVLGGKGKRAPDVYTEDFRATMTLTRSWHVGLRDPDGDSYAVTWWDDHCDDEGQQVVRGVMPFEVEVKERRQATWLLRRLQKRVDNERTLHDAGIKVSGQQY